MFVTFITIDIISELVKFDHYRDTRAAILDPYIQGIYFQNLAQNELWYLRLSLYSNFQKRKV